MKQITTDFEFFPALREVLEQPELKKRREAVERRLDQMKVAHVLTVSAIDCNEVKKNVQTP